MSFQQSTRDLKTNDALNESYKWYHHFVAGEIAGMAGSAASHPFDTIKTHIQHSMNPSDKNLTMFKQLTRSMKSTSIFSLYRGILYPFFGMGISYSIAFGVNGVCQDLCVKYCNWSNYIFEKNVKHDLTMMQLSMCGTVAGLCVSLFFSPMDRVKCWSQVNNLTTIESTNCLIKHYGFKNGLFYGSNATTLRITAQFAVYYPIYEICCNLAYVNTLKKRKDMISIDINICDVICGRMINDKSNQLSQFNLFTCGAITGFGTWIITYPLDVIKTRYQSSIPNTYFNLTHCFKLTYQEIGFMGFYRGVTPALIRAIGLHSAIFVCYENVLKLFEQ